MRFLPGCPSGGACCSLPPSMAARETERRRPTRTAGRGVATRESDRRCLHGTCVGRAARGCESNSYGGERLCWLCLFGPEPWASFGLIRMDHRIVVACVIWPSSVLIRSCDFASNCMEVTTVWTTACVMQCSIDLCQVCISLTSSACYICCSVGTSFCVQIYI